MKTLYEILGVSRTASVSQIKRAYRKLAKKLHPDMKGDSDKFREITHAYQVLSDPERRKVYDETGIAEEAKKSGPDQKLTLILAGFIMQAMQQNPLGCNPIETGRKILQAQINGLNTTIASDKEIAKRFRHVAKNVIRHGEGDNVIAAVLQNHADGAEKHAAQMQEQVETLQKVALLLNDYSWYPDSQTQPKIIRPQLGGYGRMFRELEV